MFTRSTVPVAPSIEAPEEKVPPELPLNVTVPDPVLEQNGDPAYEMVADGCTVTVIVASPVLSDAIEVQVPLLKLLIV